MDETDKNSLACLSSLKVCEWYSNLTVRVVFVHICPLDGEEDAQGNLSLTSKRILICKDAAEQVDDKYLLVVLYGHYAKTPFKKNELKVGQEVMLCRFRTERTPKKKAFKCNNKIIDSFYDFLVLIRPEDDPKVKLVAFKKLNREVSDERDKSDAEVGKEADNGKDQNLPSPKLANVQVNLSVSSTTNEGAEPPVKRLKFNEKSPKTKKQKCRPKEATESASPVLSVASAATVGQKEKPKYEFKTLYQVHCLVPVTKTCYVNVFGVVVRSELFHNQLELMLCDETSNSFPIKLLKKSNRDYPGFLGGDVVRIHRMMLSSNTMDKICIDPKDLVVFRSFNDSEEFEPISAATKFTIEEYDRRRRQELDDWFSDELINNSLSQMKEEGVVNIAGQLVRCKGYQNRMYVELWDGTKPNLKTTSQEFGALSLVPDEDEEQIRQITGNKMSVFITVYDEHTMDFSRLKPWDLFVIFAAKVKRSYKLDGHSEITLNTSYKFGRCMRPVHRDSVLGKKLLARIEGYFYNEILTGSESEPNIYSEDVDNDVQAYSKIENILVNLRQKDSEIERYSEPRTTVCEKIKTFEIKSSLEEEKCVIRDKNEKNLCDKEICEKETTDFEWDLMSEDSDDDQFHLSKQFEDELSVSSSSFTTAKSPEDSPIKTSCELDVEENEMLNDDFQDFDVIGEDPITQSNLEPLQLSMPSTSSSGICGQIKNFSPITANSKYSPSQFSSSSCSLSQLSPKSRNSLSPTYKYNVERKSTIPKQLFCSEKEYLFDDDSIRKSEVFANKLKKHLYDENETIFKKNLLHEV